MNNVEPYSMDAYDKQMTNQEEQNTNISALDRQVWSEIVGTSSSSGEKKPNQDSQSQLQDLGAAHGAVNGFEPTPSYNPEESRGRDSGEANMKAAAGQGHVPSSEYSNQYQYYMSSENGTRPPMSLPRSSSRPGSQSLAILSQVAGAPASTNPQTMSNGQATIETDFRSALHPSEQAKQAMPAGQQTSPRGQSAANSFTNQMQLQRDNLKQREEDLEERYRQLQDYAQLRIGTGTEKAGGSCTTIGDIGKESESDGDPSIRFSKFQQASTASQPGWNPKKAWGRPASATMSHTERPPQQSASGRGDEISCSQNTHTVRLNQVIAKQGDARSELGPLGKVKTATRQPQIDNGQGASQSQTEAEAHDPAIVYDRSYYNGEIGASGLRMPSGSIACSQSQQSPSKQCNQPDDSARELKAQDSLQPNVFARHELNDSLLQLADNDNHHRRSLGNHKESDKMQTGSFQAREGVESALASAGADMNNVTAMLFRAMNYRTEDQSSTPLNHDDFKMKMHDAGRNEGQFGIGTRETAQSKTTEVTQRIGHSQSNSQMLDRAGIEVTTLSVTNNQESRKELMIHENTGEQKLQQELERIQQQKQLISTFLPKDHESRRDQQSIALTPTMGPAPENALSRAAAQERGQSNSSFGKVYNLEMNLSSKFGRNFQDHLSYSKSPGHDSQKPQAYQGFQIYARPLESQPTTSLHTSGMDGLATSKEQKSGLEGQNTGNGPITGSSYFGLRAGEQDIPKEVFNGRDMSQDASRRSRGGLQATDRPISYPTNMTNMTHGDCVSPESHGQAFKRATGGEVASHVNNPNSGSGLTWRIEKCQYPPQGAPMTSSEAFTSQERYPLNSKGDMYQPQEIAGRSRSREFNGQRVESPSVKRREGLSPYSQSSRARDLQNSGLALLKKTTALLKNPPAVSNYKPLNFDIDENEHIQHAEQIHQPYDHQQHEYQQYEHQQHQSSKAFESNQSRKGAMLESNASRKGVILSLYRKNSVAGSLQERESEYRRIQDQQYRVAIGQSQERRQGLHQSSVLSKESEGRTHWMANRHLESRSSSKLEPANIKRVIPPKAHYQSKEAGPARGLQKSGSEDKIGTQSQQELRAQGKLTLGFLRRLNRNQDKDKKQNKRSTSDNGSERRRSGKGSELRSQKDNEDGRPNISAINRASSRVDESETNGRTSSRARTDANDSTYHASRSVTSKINRYKKFERELEQQKAQLEAIDKRNKEREASAAAATAKAKAKTWNSASKTKIGSVRQSERQLPSGRKEDSEKKEMHELSKKKINVESKTSLNDQYRERREFEMNRFGKPREPGAAANEYGNIPEHPSFNQQSISPHRTFDSHRGSNFTLGNQVQASAEPSPPEQALQPPQSLPGQTGWAHEIKHVDQRGMSHEKKYEQLSKSVAQPDRKAQYSATYAMPTTSSFDYNMPKLNFDYHVKPSGVRPEINIQQQGRNNSTSGLRSLNQSHEKRTQHVSYLQTTYQEEDSLARAERPEAQEEMPTQIHGDRLLPNVGSHLAPSAPDSSSRRYSYDYKTRNTRNPIKEPSTGALPSMEQNVNHASQGEPARDHQHRSKSQMIYTRSGPSYQRAPLPIGGNTPATPTVQLNNYLQRNEQLRKSQNQEHEQYSQAAKSPVPHAMHGGGSQLRTLSPPHGASQTPQGTSPFSQFSQQQPDLIPMRGPPSKQVEDRRPPHEVPDGERHPRTGADDVLMEMKSRFGRKMRDQSLEEKSQDRMQKFQIERSQDVQATQERDPLSFGRQNEVSHQGESFRQPNMNQISREGPHSSIQTTNIFREGSVIQRPRSTEQARSRSRVDALRHPTETGTSSHIAHLPTQADFSKAHSSVHQHYPQHSHHSSSIYHQVQPGQQPHGSEYQHHQLPPTYHQQQIPGSRHYSEQFDYSQNREHDYPRDLDEARGTPNMQYDRMNGRDEESRVSTLKIVGGRELSWNRQQQMSSHISREGSKVTIGSQKMERRSYGNGQQEVHMHHQNQFYQEESYREGNGNQGTATCTIPSNPQKLTEFVNTEAQTIGSIIRSPEIDVASKDLAMEMLQTATLSKNQEPSMAQTKSSYRRALPPQAPDLSVTGESFHGHSSSEQGDIKKLIKLQFEQARMLMDLQKQLLQCQDVERVAHLESVDQSISRNFHGDVTSSSQRPASSVDDDYKRMVPEAASSVVALMQGSASTRPRAADADSICDEEALLSQQHVSNFEQRQDNNDKNNGYVAYQNQAQSQTQSQAPPVGRDSQVLPTNSHTTQSKHSDLSHMKRLKQVRVKKKESYMSQENDVNNEATKSKKNSQAVLQSSASQAAPNADPLSKHNRANRSHIAKASAALSHASSIAIPNLQAINSNRSLHSAVSKQSQLQLSQISQQKASTLALIQKIYKQMEKIDEQISHKEKVDEQRYREMERKMKKLWKKYSRVKQDNEQMHQQSSQLLSLQPSQRFQVRSLAVDAGASSCDFENSKKRGHKTKSTKDGVEKKGRHKSRGELGKGSIMSEFKPLSSVEATDQTFKSSLQEAAHGKNIKETERSAIQIVEHDSRHNRNSENQNDYRAINDNSALSHSYVEPVERAGLATKITQVNELLADEPLQPTSECASYNQKDALVDQAQQFPSAQRSVRGTELSTTSDAPLKSEALLKDAENPSFGAQFPSAQEASQYENEVKRRNQKVMKTTDSQHRLQSRQSSSSASGLGNRINKQILDASSLQINSMQSQYSQSGNPTGPPPTGGHANHKGSHQRLHTAVHDAPSASSRTQNNSRACLNQGEHRNGRSIMKNQVLDNLDDVDVAATTSSCNPEKESALQLGSSAGLAEETLQIQRRREEPNQLQDDAMKQVKGALEEVKTLTNNQGELENQIQHMNGAIAQLKEGYQSQIDSMKQFYQEQINQLRQEVHKKERSQSRGRAGLSSGMGTPAAALQNRMKSLSNENILNLTNLSMSASEKKLVTNQNNASSIKDPSPVQVPQTVSPITRSNQQPLRLATPKIDGERLEKQEKTLPSAKNLPAPLTEALALPGGPGPESQAALAKLMDLRKFYETIEQLNEAVSQKERLEEKLMKIKEKVHVAKNIRSQQRDRSKGSRDRHAKRGLDVAKPAEAAPGEDSGMQIVSREAEVQSSSERTRDYGDESRRGKNGNDKMQSMYIEDEMAALSGVTLSDLPARDVPDDSTAPMQTSCREDTQGPVNEFEGSQSKIQFQEQSSLYERQKNETTMFNQSGEHPNSYFAAQGLPPISGPRSETKNYQRQSVQKHGAAERQSTKQTADFTQGHYSSQLSSALQGDGGRSNLSHISHQNSVMHEQARGQLDHSLNYNCLPNELMQANMGQRGNPVLVQKSYESQPAAGSTHSVGSARETSKSTENLGRMVQRQMVTPYVGGERFMQPFIPGQGIENKNVRSSQQLHGGTSHQLHRSTALAPGLVLLDSHSVSQMPHADQLHTIQQNTPEHMDGLSEVYLRDTTQQSMAAGASHTHHNANHSTLESSMQHQVMQDPRRGVYQKIVGLQSMSHQMSGGLFTPGQQYGQQNQLRNVEYKYPMQQQPQQPGSQPVYIPNQVLGAGVSPVATSNALSFSMPATRMGTINAESGQASKYILRQDIQDGTRAHQVPHVNVLQDRRNTSPIAVHRVEQQHIQNSGDPRSRQLAHQQMTAPNGTYPATAILAQATPLYLQPRPVIAQPLHPQKTTAVGNPPQTLILQPQTKSHTSAVSNPSPTLQPKIASQPVQQYQIDPRFLHPSSQAASSAAQKQQPTSGKNNVMKEEDMDNGEEISYTMHSSSIEASTQSEQTSRATSEATSSYPAYSERSESQAQEEIPERKGKGIDDLDVRINENNMHRQPTASKGKGTGQHQQDINATLMPQVRNPFTTSHSSSMKMQYQY